MMSGWFRHSWAWVAFAVGCSGAQSRVRDDVPKDFCGTGGHPRPLDPNIVLTTVSPNGDVIDWIPAASQTPDGTAPASPPSSAPLPPDAIGASSKTLNAPDAALPANTDTLGPKGPPGTAPRLRSNASKCDCDEGYEKQANGTCRAVLEVCVREGGSASGKTFTRCCPGLQGVRPYQRQGDQCLDVGVDYAVCVHCGNGICGPGEDNCNCPGDCGVAQ